MRTHYLTSLDTADDYGVLEAYINKTSSKRMRDARRIQRTLRRFATR